MFRQALKAHARVVTAAALTAPVALSCARSEKRVYASGEALGRGVRLELWKAKHENVVVLDLESEVVQLGMTRIRDSESQGSQFVHEADSVLRASVDLALTALPNDDEAVVTTPRGHRVKGMVFEDDVKVCGIAIASKPEVQKGLLQVLHLALPFESPLGEVLLETSDDRIGAKIVRSDLPDLEDREVILLCPELNALDKVGKVIHVLRQEGVAQDKITVVTLVTCQEAADKFCQEFGDARLVTASFDSARDRSGYIVPGLGDFEHRYAGGAPSELPAEPAAEDEDDGKGSGGGGWWPFGGSK
ncbi:TPA: hypothetical protein N0F65_008330 [Lagenidium giganteum]|uniref:Phosphoribosyltransferase domain-containing protein n=1 Tax=Lagenidium giganteum TaxID=4803 RepID=A0AAV2YSU4_9STRA|nr:TPA: hypothetical protein N0F65_008330 [Lagenidium giganteum]